MVYNPYFSDLRCSFQTIIYKMGKNREKWLLCNWNFLLE